MPSGPGEDDPRSRKSRSVVPPGTVVTGASAGDAAAATRSTAPTHHPGAEHALLWALAVLPLALTVVDVALARGFGVAVLEGTHVAGVASGGLVVADWQQVRHRVGRPWLMVVVGVLLAPVYLFWRCRATGRSQAPLAVWIAALVLVIAVEVAVAPTAAHGEIDLGALEARISEELTAEVGPPAVEATCPPGQPAEEGHTFRCEAEYDGEVVPVVVIVENERGDVIWRPEPPSGAP